MITPTPVMNVFRSAVMTSRVISSASFSRRVISLQQRSTRREAAEQLEISAYRLSHGFDLFRASLELCWFWSILDIVTVSGVTPHGHAPTLDEAKAKRWRLIDGQSCGLRRRWLGRSYRPNRT
jgi:hypothetical protein